MTRMLAALALLLLAPAARAADLPWPDTAPGRHAQAYFPAYAADEPAMRAFWTAHGDAQALAQRPVAPRLEVWKEMRAQHGALTPEAIVEQGASFVAVRARNAHGDPLIVRFLCSDDPAHGLLALRVEDAASAPEDAPLAGAPPTDAEIVAGLAAEVDSLARAGAFSGTVLLDKGGQQLYARAAGEASRERHEPMRMETRMNVGSIDKQFTSVAIRQLAQQGRLKLDDTIDRYLADYPRPAASKITIRMLLDHKSGVPDVLHDPALWKDPQRVRTSKAWYELVRTRPLDFEPGSQQHYSNGGYVVLGEIISRVSGEDYYDYVAKHVTAPAGMTRTAFDAVDDPVNDRATSYPAGGDKVQPGRGSAAGGGYSTVGDLLRFAQALRAGKLLDPAKGDDVVGPHPGMAAAGGAPGVNGLLEMEGPYTLAVLSNLDPPAAERFSRTTGRALRLAAGDDFRGPRHEIRAGGH